MKLFETGPKSYMVVNFGTENSYDPLDPDWHRGLPNPWTPWFAWRPVMIHGKKVWLKTVYRRCGKLRLSPNGKAMSVGWEYGTIFDVLKDEN